MQRLEVSGAVRLIYRSLGVKGLNIMSTCQHLSLIMTQIPSGARCRYVCVCVCDIICVYVESHIHYRIYK